MANYWVNPLGSNTSPYDTREKGAINLITPLGLALSDGDTITLTASEDHILGIAQKTISASITVQAEGWTLSDLPTARVTLQGASSLKLLASNKQIKWRGIHIDGGTSYNYAPTGTNFLFTAPNTNDFSGSTLDFERCRISRVTADSTGVDRSSGWLNIAASTATKSKLRMVDCEIDNNHNTCDAGIKKYVATISQMDVDFVRVDWHDNGNYGTGDMGLMFINASQTSTVPLWNVIGSEFYGNWGGNPGGDGGAFYFHAVASAGIKATLYTENNYWHDNAGHKGGAFWAAQNVDHDSVRELFERNEALTYGGGACGRGGNTYLTPDTDLGYSRFFATNFVSNRATGAGGYGGALFCVNLNGRLDIDQCDFADNTAAIMGHTLFAQTPAASTTTETPRIRNSRIYGGRSGGDGYHIRTENTDARWKISNVAVAGGLKSIYGATRVENVYDTDLDSEYRPLGVGPAAALAADYKGRSSTAWTKHDAQGNPWDNPPSMGRFSRR